MKQYLNRRLILCLLVLICIFFITFEADAKTINNTQKIDHDKFYTNLTITGTGKLVIQNNVTITVAEDLIIEKNGVIDAFGNKGSDGLDGGKDEDGENGNSGGNGKDIDLIVGNNAVIEGEIIADGGDGGNGGNGGDDDVFHWGEAGEGGDGGNGGNAGQITIEAKYLNLSSSASISSVGGAKGEKGDGGYNGIFRGYSANGEDGEKGIPTNTIFNIGYGGSGADETIEEANKRIQEVCTPDTSEINRDTMQPLAPTHLRIRDDNDKIIGDSGYTNDTSPLFMWDSVDDRPPSDEIPKSGFRKYKIVEQNGKISTTHTSNNSKSFSNLSDGQYIIEVAAQDNAGHVNYDPDIYGDWSNGFVFYIDTVPPSVPNNLSATEVSIDQLTINWTNSNDEYGIDHYEVKFYKGASTSSVIYLNDVPKTDNGFNKSTCTINEEFDFNQRIRYEVVAVDKAGNKSDPVTGEIITPPAPTSITNITTGGEAGNYYGELEIESQGDKVYEYRVLRKKADETEYNVESDWFTTNVVEGEVINFIDRMGNISTEPHQKYNYAIQTRNSDRALETKEDYSDIIQIKNNLPEAEGVISPETNALFNERNIELKINPFTDEDNDSLRYNFILEYKNSDGDWQVSDELDGTSFVKSSDEISIMAKSLAEGEYRWKVEADDHYDTVSTSYYYFQTDFTAPARPGFNLEESNIISEGIANIYDNSLYTNNQSLTLKNIEVTNDVKEIKVYEDGTLLTSLSSITSPQDIKLVLSNIEGSKDIRITAVDEVGNEGQPRVINCIYDTQTPNNPIDFTYRGGSTSLTVNWEEPSDQGDSGIDYYLLEYKRVNQIDSTYISRQVENIQSTITALDDNEPIQVRIKAVDKAGNQNSSWVSKEEGYYGYSLPEKGIILSHSFDYEEDQDGGYTHFVDLAVQQVKADAFKIRREDINTGNISESEWITDASQTSFVDQIQPHREYNYWVITRNGRGEEVVSNRYNFKVVNNEPTKPIVNQSEYKYINQLPVELRTEGATDYDLDPLSYYFTLIDVVGNKIVDRQKSNTQDGDKLSYLVATDMLTEGETYQWWVEVEDGQGSSIQSDSITSTIDLTEPQVSLTESNQEYLSDLTIRAQISDEISGVKEIRYYWNDNEDNPTVISLGEGIYQEYIAIEAPHGSNQLYLQAVDNAGNETNLLNKRYLIDKTAPELQNLIVEGQVIDSKYYTTNPKTLYGTWSVIEDQTAIDYYRYAVVSADELGQVDGLSSNRFTRVEVDAMQEEFDQVAKNLLEENKEYYLAVEAINQVGRSSGVLVSENGVVIDSIAPGIGEITLENIINARDKFYINSLQDLSLSVNVSDLGSGLAQKRYALVKDINQLETANWLSSLAELKDSVQVKDGEIYYLAIKAIDKLGQSSIEYTKPLVIDQTEPEIIQLIAGNELQINSQSDIYQVRPNYDIPVSLNIEDETALAKVTYSIGTDKGDNSVSYDIYPTKDGWVDLDNDFIQQFILDEELIDGTYYLNVRVTNKAGLVTEYSSNPIRVDSSIPPVPQVKDDGSFIANNSELHFSWSFPDTEQTTTAYEYQLVDKSNNIIRDWQQISLESDRNDYIAQDLDLIDNKSYFVKIRACYEDNSKSDIGWSDGIIVDTTAPVELNIDDGAYTTSDKLHVNWSATDNESSIREYQIKVGTTPGGDDITAGWIKLDNSGDGVLEELNLNPDQLYFTTLRAINGAGLISITTSDGFRVDDTPPIVPLVLDDGSYTTQKYLQFNWHWSETDPESDIKEYQYTLLTAREVTAGTEWQSADLNREVEFNQELVDGQRYYLAVKAINKAGLASIGYSNGILIDTTAPTPPEVDDLVNYQLASDDSLSAHFIASDQESNISHYRYTIGTLNDSDSVVTDQEITSEDITELELPLDLGEVYFFTVKAINNAGLVSMEGKSDGIKIIDDYPKINNAKDYGDFTTFADKIIVSWDCNSSDVPIDHYEIAVSRSSTATNLNWQVVNDKQAIITPDQLGLEKFEDGVKYYVYIRGVNLAGIKTPIDKVGKTDGIMVDSTPPSRPEIIHADSYTTNNFTLQWQSREEDSGIAGYRYAIGTTRGGTDITNGWQYIETDQELYNQVLNLNLEHNQRYYVTVQAKNLVGLWSEISYDQGVIADLTPPTRPVIGYVSDYIASLEEITDVTWQSIDLQTGITGYRYQVVQNKTNLDWGNVAAHEITKNELTFNIHNLSLTETEEYYIALQTRNRLGVWSETGFSHQLTVDTTPPEVILENLDQELVTNSGVIDVPWQTNEESTVYYRLIRPDGSIDPEIGYYQQKTEQNISYTYAFNEDKSLEGIYYLELYAVDLAGNRGEVTVQDIRLNAKPRINVGSDLSVFKGKETNFTAEVFDPDGEVVTYIWDFGDGSIVSNQIAPIHNYTELGRYQVTLTCIDNDGGQASDNLWIEVTNTTEGSLIMDETWTDEMKITDTVVVPNWVTLTIEAGTKIEFPRDAELTIYGDLIVEGAPSQQVLFTTPSVLEEWEGIRVDNRISQVNITEAIIENAYRGITLNQNSSELDSLILRNNQVGLHLINSSPLVKYSQVLDSEVYGIKEDGESNPSLIGNYFEGNQAGDYYDSLLTILTLNELLELNMNDN